MLQKLIREMGTLMQNIKLPPMDTRNDNDEMTQYIQNRIGSENIDKDTINKVIEYQLMYMQLEIETKMNELKETLK